MWRMSNAQALIFVAAIVIAVAMLEHVVFDWNRDSQ